MAKTQTRLSILRSIRLFLILFCMLQISRPNTSHWSEVSARNPATVRSLYVVMFAIISDDGFYFHFLMTILRDSHDSVNFPIGARFRLRFARTGSLFRLFSQSVGLDLGIKAPLSHRGSFDILMFFF